MTFKNVLIEIINIVNHQNYETESKYFNVNVSITDKLFTLKFLDKFTDPKGHRKVKRKVRFTGIGYQCNQKKKVKVFVEDALASVFEVVFHLCSTDLTIKFSNALKEHDILEWKFGSSQNDVANNRDLMFQSNLVIAMFDWVETFCLTMNKLYDDFEYPDVDMLEKIMEKIIRKDELPLGPDAQDDNIRRVMCFLTLDTLSSFIAELSHKGDKIVMEALCSLVGVHLLKVVEAKIRFYDCRAALELLRRVHAFLREGTGKVERDVYYIGKISATIRELGDAVFKSMINQRSRN